MDARCRKDESGYQNALFVARENAEKKKDPILQEPR